MKIAGYLVDAALNESHNRDADVTEFPVESGATITDHVRIKPSTFTVKGVISDTPLPDQLAELRSGSNLKPSEEGRVVLEGIFEDADPVTVETNLKVYENMVMQALAFDLDGQSGEALQFTATFKQIVIEQNVRVLVRTVTIGAGRVNRGNLYGKPPGWIGTDALGRNITSSKLGPGVDPIYTRADGSVVSVDEARRAAAQNDAVLVKYDNGNPPHAIPVSVFDSQPNAQPNAPPYWAPTKWPIK